MVFHRSMFDWRSRVGLISHGYMCIVLNMKFIWCNGFPEIYAHLEEGGWGQSVWGICAIYICNFFGIIVFQISLLNCGGRSANRSAKFGVAVLKASMLD